MAGKEDSKREQQGSSTGSIARNFKSSVRDRLGSSRPKHMPHKAYSTPVRRPLFSTTLEQHTKGQRRDKEDTEAVSQRTSMHVSSGFDKKYKIARAEADLERLHQESLELDAHLSYLRKEEESSHTIIGGQYEKTPSSRSHTRRELMSSTELYDDHRYQSRMRHVDERRNRDSRLYGTSNIPHSKRPRTPEKISEREKVGIYLGREGHRTNPYVPVSKPIVGRENREGEKPDHNLDVGYNMHDGNGILCGREEYQLPIRPIQPPVMPISDPVMDRIADLERRLAIAEARPIPGSFAEAIIPMPLDPKSPFSAAIDLEKADPKKKLPPLEMYDGAGDPYDHTSSYERVMKYYNHSEAGMCQIFVTTLKHGAK